jgi:hypothetical protein
LHFAALRNLQWTQTPTMVAALSCCVHDVNPASPQTEKKEGAPAAAKA